MRVSLKGKNLHNSLLSVHCHKRQLTENLTPFYAANAEDENFMNWKSNSYDLLQRVPGKQKNVRKTRRCRDRALDKGEYLMIIFLISH